MNLIFWTRLFCILFLISFVANLVLGDRIIVWRDFMSGVVFAIAVYYLEPPIRNFLGKKIYRSPSR